MRHPAIVALAVLAAVGLTACVPSDGITSFTGYHRGGESVRIENLTIADGRYRIGYAMDVQLLSRDPEAVVRCGIVDNNGTIEYLGQVKTEARAGDGWVRLAWEATYDLPEITLGIRCAPTTAGVFTLRVRDVALTALPTADYR